MARRNQYKRARKGTYKNQGYFFKKQDRGTVGITNTSNDGIKGFVPRGGPPTTSVQGNESVYITRSAYLTNTGSGDNALTDGTFGQNASRQWCLVSLKIYAVSNVGRLSMRIAPAGDEANSKEGCNIVDYYSENHSPKVGAYIRPANRQWQISGTLFNTQIATYSVGDVLSESATHKVVAYATFCVKF